MNPIARGILFCAFGQAMCAVRSCAAAAHAIAPFPVSRGLREDAVGFVTSGSATAVAAGSSLTVHQTSNSTTLNWASFNIPVRADRSSSNNPRAAPLR